MKNTYLLMGVLGLGSVFSAFDKQGQTKKTRKPNILMFAVDDLNVYNTVLGSLPMNFLQKVYPDPHVRAEIMKRLTPNLQKLSEGAVTFNNAFCASPLCGPSRTALLTGVPTHVSGYYEHDKHFRGYETLTDIVTLPQLFKENGYYTAGAGKVFHKWKAYLDRGYFSDWPDQLYSWSDWVESDAGTGVASGLKFKAEENISKYWDPAGKAPKDYRRFGVTNVPREMSADYSNAEFIYKLVTKGEADQYDYRERVYHLELPKDKPWFLACGFFAPHLPWVVPQEFFDRFPTDEMSITRELLDWIREDVKDLSPTGQGLVRKSGFHDLLAYGVELDGVDGDLDAWKAAFQAYLATVSFCDANIGIWLKTVNENPERDNTIVLLWSDHGYHIGDKLREGKTTLWEASNHCNLLIIDPTNKDNFGKRCNANVSLQDLYPTLTSMAGLERPAHVHGYNLVPLLQDPDSEWTHPVLNTFQEGNHALRTGQHRFIRFRNGDTELYDIVNDPMEINNLAQNDSCQDIVQEMNEMLDQCLKMKPEEFK